VPYITGGFPGVAGRDPCRGGSGADAIEIGIPFSDPVMDGP
jgi:tryptophan synthase alpha chain